jgi:hypothetical protein
MRVRELSSVPVGVDYVEVFTYVVKSHSTSQQEYILYTVKKLFSIFLSPARMSLTKLSLDGGIIQYKVFPPRESLVSDILAGGWEYRKALFTVYNQKGIVPH